MPHLTPEELCKRLKLKSSKTLYQWRLAKYGPAYIELRGNILYPLDSVEKFEKDNMHGGE